jgi:hypothetical protein
MMVILPEDFLANCVRLPLRIYLVGGLVLVISVECVCARNVGTHTSRSASYLHKGDSCG